MYMFQHSSVSLFGLALVKIKAQVQEEGAELLYALQSRRGITLKYDRFFDNVTNIL